LLLNPWPLIVTDAPTGPPAGENDAMLTAVVAAVRAIEVTLPDASYVYCTLEPSGSITRMSRPSASYEYSVAA
jgi:hypothetical protein